MNIGVVDVKISKLSPVLEFVPVRSVRRLVPKASKPSAAEWYATEASVRDHSRRKRRLGEAVERVSDRLQEDENGNPLVFRNSIIENNRDLVDVVPRLNIFGDDDLARLCEQVKDRIASVEPDALRPSKSFDPAARAQVKRDADEMMEKFAGYFVPPPAPVREAA